MFTLFIICIVISFFWTVTGLLQVLLLTESLIIFIFLICLAVCSLVNTCYLVSFALIILILGGLELALCFLLLS